MSALIGASSSGLGLLNNALYVGRVVWNRRQWLKDPETGSRRYIERPRTEWQERDAPELRIVSDEVWHRVHARSIMRGTRTGKGAAPRTLFSGLLRCATCGGAVVAIDARRYGCSVHKDRGAAVCASAEAWPRTVVDRRLVAEVRDELQRPDAIAELHLEVRELTRTAPAPHGRLPALHAEISRLVDAIARTGYSEALAGRLRVAEEEAKWLAAAPAPAPSGNELAARIVAAYKRQLLTLQAALDDQADLALTRQILGDMLGPVTLLKERRRELRRIR